MLLFAILGLQYRSTWAERYVAACTNRQQHISQRLREIPGAFCLVFGIWRGERQACLTECQREFEQRGVQTGRVSAHARPELCGPSRLPLDFLLQLFNAQSKLHFSALVASACPRYMHEGDLSFLPPVPMVRWSRIAFAGLSNLLVGENDNALMAGKSRACDLLSISKYSLRWDAPTTPYPQFRLCRERDLPTAKGK